MLLWRKQSETRHVVGVLCCFALFLLVIFLCLMLWLVLVLVLRLADVHHPNQ